MEDYLKVLYRKSSHPIKETDKRRISALFLHEKGIENFRFSPEGVYVEYNSYICGSDQLVKILDKNGFCEEKKKLGFFAMQIRHLADSNKKIYGNRKPGCCG